jgi:hypothetical protein
VLVLVLLLLLLLLLLLQVNNQPPTLGEMAIACGVINDATSAGQKPLAAVAAMYSYFSSNGSSNWCYNFTYDPKLPVLPDSPTGYNSYTYQCCTQATVYSSELPARGDDGTLNPERIPVPVKDIEYNCRWESMQAGGGGLAGLGGMYMW